MKIVFLGDSFTRGFGVKESENWVSRLSLANCEFINCGINGDTTSGMLARFSIDVIEKSPQYVVITGGTNDFIAGSDEGIPPNNIMSMVHQAFHNNIIPILGMAPGFLPEKVRDDWFAFSDFNEVFDKQQRLCLWMKRFCETFHVFFIDFYSEFEKIKSLHPEENYHIDGIHLTANAHTHICEIAMKSFNSFIKR